MLENRNLDEEQVTKITSVSRQQQLLEMTVIGNDTFTLNVQHGLMTAQQYILVMEYAAVMGAFLSLIGVISNIIIIKIFIAMGVNDGVTVSFLSLAIYDLAYLIAGVSLGINTMFYISELKSTRRFKIEPYGLSIYFTNVMILINVANILTTTFLAIARSMCVAKPLQFKNTFTRNRAGLFMAGFAVLSVSIYMPIFTNMGMSERFDMLTNTSRLSWWGTAGREKAKEMVWVFTEMVLPVSTELTIIICVVIMTNCLRESARFRQSSMATTGTKFDASHNDQASTCKENKADSDLENRTPKLTGKDVRVVQQVVLISVVYILCSVPKHFISVVAVFEPGFAIGKRYMKVYMSVNGLRKHFEILNSAVNLLIYYKYNTKFRLLLSNQAE